MSEAQRSALNALLFCTGDQSKDIVLALATNCPGGLDSAVANCIDEVLEFPLPREDERFELLNLYLDKREIAELMASVQAAAYRSENCVLDPTLFREVVDYKAAEHQQRRKLAVGDGGRV
ncbi:hypothetical protein GOBAR_AA24879 [Gossypium barbadense]|uniref:ATPase AAA-type core domain-containing protein n=1 Tax=Gossypium barbadense TaxID=3634 RepID=A0A2P5WXH0_GOSBA|nr:hypothetical protein GOBAR_AA24879 [Gossypium barbadense]